MDDAAGGGAAGAEAVSVPANESDVDVDDDFDDSSNDLAEDAAAYGFDSEMLRWKDSNHESVLFSNFTHTVSFLSFNPKALRQRLHPQLLVHLENNGINVGEDLMYLNSNHWKILSSLTGVLRSEAEARDIMGGNFCLTGDSLLKMLAIFYRIRCGVPVILLGIKSTAYMAHSLSCLINSSTGMHFICIVVYSSVVFLMPSI
jgi:hypothetical protein